MMLDLDYFKKRLFNIMAYDFDRIIDRRPTESNKWHSFPEDVLPMYVADMDFLSPDPVIKALEARVQHGIFGYPNEPDGLRKIIVERMERHFNWHVQPEWIVFVHSYMLPKMQEFYARKWSLHTILMEAIRSISMYSKMPSLRKHDYSFYAIRTILWEGFTKAKNWK
jgi:hypothetical protein